MPDAVGKSLNKIGGRLFGLQKKRKLNARLNKRGPTRIEQIVKKPAKLSPSLSLKSDRGLP